MNDEELDRCAEIEYQCWRENFSPMLEISEILYYQTIESFRKGLQTLTKYGFYKPNTAIIYTSEFKVINRVRTEIRTVSGFAVIRQHKSGRDEYVIEKLFVAPEYQGRGIGQRLLEWIITNFSDKSISVSVFEQNRIAQHLLLKNGFRQTYVANSQLTYGKNAVNIRNVYYKLDKMEEE